MASTNLVCIRCHQPVIANEASYEVFERMHWLCFPLEVEHLADPEVPCADPACPWWHIQVFREALVRLGHDPQAILDQAIQKR